MSAPTTSSTPSITSSVSPTLSNTNVNTIMSPTLSSALTTAVPHIEATWLRRRGSVKTIFKNYTHESNRSRTYRYTTQRGNPYLKLTPPSSLPLGHNLNGNEEGEELYSNTPSDGRELNNCHPERHFQPI